MDFWVSLYQFVAAEGELPVSYGPLHLIWVGITLILTVVLLCTCKNLSDKGVRKLAGGFWIALVLLEIMKQLIYSFSVVDGKLVWDYAWYIFPFQFCASPLYILPFVAFAKDGKLRDSAITFIATFSMFAGLCVYVFPNDVFAYYQIINSQALFHHGVQIFLGVYLAFRYRDKMHFKNLVNATVIFSVLAGIAMILNELVHGYLVQNGMGDTFNMYFISPYYDCTLPVLSIVYDLVPYPVFLCVYIFGFMLCAGLMMLLMKGLVKLTKYDK